MKKLLLIISGLIFSVNTVNAQLGVGAPLPSTSSQLDVVSTNKGILIPRVSLTSSTDATTISNGNVNSLLVFNTQTIADIKPGYYYWYTNKWNALGAGGSATLTSESFDPVTGILIYNDENGTTTSLNLSTMVPNFETLTSAAFVPATGVLTYNDEKGLATVMDLSTMVPNFETLTSAAFVPTTGILTYNDEKGIATNMDLSGLSSNNWLVDLTTDKATLNTQNIYQMGNVGIGTTSIIPDVAFDARGALRSGSGHIGTVGTNSVAFGTNNTSAGVNSIAVGSFTQANEEQSFAGGRGSTVATGAFDGFAYGFANQANAPQSVAFGSATKADGYQSFSTGGGTVATSFSETAIGIFNAIRTGNPSNVTSTDPLFQIGNGAVNGSVLSNALTVLKNGNTGIGIAGVEAAAKPTERLDIGSGNLRVRDINTNVGTGTENIVVADATGIFKTLPSTSINNNNWLVDLTTDKATLNTQNIYQMGNVGIGTTTILPGVALDVRGAIRNGSGNIGTIGANSVAFGNANSVTGANSAAIGSNNSAKEDNSFAGGFGSVVEVGASASISFGFSNFAIGSPSAVFGVGNITRGNRSFATGSLNVAPSFAETVIGISNAITAAANVATITLTDPLFQVGNGAIDHSILSNAMTILKNGNTGIGIGGAEAAAKPTERLDIGSGNLRVRDINTNVGTGTENIVVADANGIFKTISSAALVGSNWQAGGNSGTTAGTNYIGTNDAQDFVVKTNTNEVARVTQTGNVGIGTATPNNKLEITAATPNTSGLTFTNLNSASPGDATVLTPLGVNATGTVVAMLPDTRYAVRQVAADYTVTLTDETIVVDPTAASVIITLPAEVCLRGKRYNVVKNFTTPNTVNIVSAAGITVAGVAMRIVGQTIVVQYDGVSNWLLLQ